MVFIQLLFVQQQVNGQIIPQVSQSSIYKNAIIMPPSTSKFMPKFSLEWEEITSASEISSNYIDFYSQCALGSDKTVKTTDIDNVKNNLNNGLKVIKWKFTVGLTSVFYNALFGFSDGSASGWTRMKNVMSQNSAYSANINGKWKTTTGSGSSSSSTTTTTSTTKFNFYSSLVHPPAVPRFDRSPSNTNPGLSGYVPLSSLNTTLYDILSGTRLLYNTQSLLSSKNLVPLIVKGDDIDSVYNNNTANSTMKNLESIREDFNNDDDFSYLNGGKGQTSSIGALLRSRSQTNWTNISTEKSKFVVMNSYENFLYSFDFYFTTTNCLNDLTNSNSSSGNELYFFVTTFGYYSLLSTKLGSNFDSSWNNNFQKMILAFNLTNFLTSPNGHKPWMNISSSTGTNTGTTSTATTTTPTFQDNSARNFISLFHFNPLTTYQQLRYLRTTHVFFYGLIILTILFIFRKQQPVKSRFMINGSVCAVAIFYGLFGIVMSAAVPNYDSIVSAAEVLFYLVLGFLYVLSAVRYFFSRNLYRTMRINFSKEKKKKEKKDSDTFEQKQLKLLRLLANLASWKFFLVIVIIVVVLVAGLSIFIMVSVLTGAADEFSVAISQVATYVKLAGLLGMVFPTAIISIILDASINAKRIFKKGGIKWYLIQDDPLLFRAEFAVFIPTVCLGILLFGLDQYNLGITWWDMETKAASYLGHGIVYTVFEVSLLLLGCGGFIVIIQTVQSIRMAIRRGSLFEKKTETDGVKKSSAAGKSSGGELGIGEKTEFELFMDSAEARAILKQYCESEFSLENFLLFEMVEELNKLVIIEQTTPSTTTTVEPKALKPKQLLSVQQPGGSFRMSGDYTSNGIVPSPSTLTPTSGLPFSTTTAGNATTITAGAGASNATTITANNASGSGGLLNPTTNNDNTSMTTSFTSSGSEVVFLQNNNEQEPTSPTSPSTMSEPYSPSSKSIMGQGKNKADQLTVQIDRMIVKMLKTYLNENSVLEVNLPNTTRKQVLQAFRKRVYPDDMSKGSGGSKNFDKSPRSVRPDTDKKPESIDVEILAILKQDVWLNLKDTFGRLQLTSEYQLLKKKQALEKELNIV